MGLSALAALAAPNWASSYSPALPPIELLCMVKAALLREHAKMNKNPCAGSENIKAWFVHFFVSRAYEAASLSSLVSVQAEATP